MTTETETATTDGLADMMATLRGLCRTGRTRGYDWRIRQLEGIERFCAQEEKAIAEALAADLGRPAFDAWFADVASSAAEARFARKHLRSWMRPVKQRLPMVQAPGKARIQYEPLGVVLVIAPWNYPVYLALGPLVAAVAAGNCVVVKPSELAPATSRLLAEVLVRYVDADAIRVVEGDGATTQELLALGFDHALFTGGTEVGRKIMAGAAPSLTPVTLELGGKSPVIVTADADLGVTARRIAWVKTMNSGQTCIAPDYVLVEESVKEALIAELRTALTAVTRDRPDGLPIVNDRQYDRLASALKATKGEIVHGGQLDDRRCRITPALVIDPDLDEPAMTEEIFGPILPILGYRSQREVIDLVNARPKPLALYVFAKDTAVADRLIEAIPAGGAVVNHVAIHCLVPSLPFGGVGASGMGAYHGEWGFWTLSHRKAVVTKPFKPDPRMFYPPYGKVARGLMRRLF